MSMIDAVQPEYAQWMKAQGQTPDLWDIVEFPKGFEQFWKPTPKWQLLLQFSMFTAFNQAYLHIDLSVID